MPRCCKCERVDTTAEMRRRKAPHTGEHVCKDINRCRARRSMLRRLRTIQSEKLPGELEKARAVQAPDRDQRLWVRLLETEMPRGAAKATG